MIEWKQTERNGETKWHPYQKFYLENRTKAPGNVWKDFFVPEEYSSPLWRMTLKVIKKQLEIYKKLI